MKYCSHCGKEVEDEAVVCVHCGCALPSKRHDSTKDIMAILIKVFLIIGCVTVGWALIPLAWCIPMTVSIFNKLKENKPISTGLKVCTLLFVNLVAGILLLCIDTVEDD